MGELTSGGKCQPERERYIPNKLTELERQITELEECFGDLQGRLSSVRSNDVESAELAKNSEAVELPCPLAEHLRVQTSRIRSVCFRIANQLSALEI